MSIPGQGMMSARSGGYPRLSARVQLSSSLCAGVSIFAAGSLSHRFIEGEGFMVLMASMGASAVILYCVPDSPMAKPWPLIGGHLFSGLTGICCALWLPVPWQAGAAVAISILVMHVTHTLHPPGGATALTAVLGGEHVHQLGFMFLLTPLAVNVGLMFLMHAVYVLSRKPFSVRHPVELKPVQDDNSFVQPGDLHAALQELDEYVDIDEAELARIYRLAAEHAAQRAAAAKSDSRVKSHD
ncbi:HPP family protein [Candidatus Methylospira mobilis]|nr:HPP family protein [Candidatus Methylospira mobilis]WNV03111.1 HPP family protein [Candidatus Methylospira mobilis]